MIGFRVYLLDFDGTLAATRPAGVAGLTRTLAERGMAVPASRMEAVIGTGVPLEVTLATLAPQLTDADIADCATRYRALYPDIDQELTALYDGVHDTIAGLNRNGGKVVVLSNKSRATLEAALARFAILDQASAVLAADPGLPVKPDPQVFHRRVRPLFDGLAPSDFVMVGDTAADIAFAQAAGIASCWVSYGYGDADHCLAMKPDFVVHTLPDLLTIGAEPA
jgi:phosphoglycolate phosphatase